VRKAHLIGLAAIAASVGTAARARATNVTEFPDNGSEQMARGGAWVARASDPLAVTFNPAGLAGQPSRVTIQNNFIVHHTCFSRIQAAGDTSQDPMADPLGRFPRVCNDIAPTLNPQIGATLRVNDRLGLGLLVIGPSSGGEKTFPEFVSDASGNPQAPPTRYLLIKESGIILFPSVGVGWEIVDNLRIGASVSWGFAKLKLASAAPAVNTDRARPDNDVRANLQIADYFVPGMSIGTIWSATPEIDVAGWYKWSDAIRASGDAGTAANWYSKANAQGDDSAVRYADTIFEDCGTGTKTTACGSGGNAKVKFVIPMEAKLGLRYHKPRARFAGDAAGPYARPRDPLLDDVFDVEADLTWANDSAADTVQIRFPGDASGKGLLPVAIPGSELPPNADQVRGYKDVFGVRVGGDVNVVPDKLALRAGTFAETSAGGAPYQSIDFAPSARFGLALGGTYRFRVGAGDDAPALELMVGYGHVFFATQHRDDRTLDGLPALAGTSCNNSDPVSPEACSNGFQRYRTKWPVNLGTITNAVNVVNVGLAYRF
jgi:long-chain fatty acid transport protein